MNLQEYLANLAAELRNSQYSDSPRCDEHGFPDYIAPKTGGVQIKFTHNARQFLKEISLLIYENRSPNNPKIELNKFIKIAKQVVVNMFAEDKFNCDLMGKDKAVSKELKASIEEEINKQTTAFTHYFPAWTLGLELKKPFEFGPVTLFSRSDWLSSVDFSQYAKDTHLGKKEANNQWKDIVIKRLNGENLQNFPLNLATDIYRAINHCPSLVKVTINGFEQNLSRKFAMIVAKTALDSLSLIFRDDKAFLKQAIYGERLVPFHLYSLLETDGYLWDTGWAMTDRVTLYPKSTRDFDKKTKTIVLPSITSILHGLLTPEEHHYPKLTMRWVTALNWLAEGCRESNDAIAIAKLGSSLDVLSCGGKADGISKMVSNLLQTEEDCIVIESKGTTLKVLIKQIYDDGRSKILHGIDNDRLKSLETERAHAFSVASDALISAAICLSDYKGADEDNAFKTMRPSKVAEVSDS